MIPYIIISKEQADAVKGNYGKYSILEPIELPDGNYGIPMRLIDNPEFIEIKTILEKYKKDEEVENINRLQKRKNDVCLEEGKTYVYKDNIITVEHTTTVKIDELLDNKECEINKIMPSKQNKEKGKGSLNEMIEIDEYENEIQIEENKYYLSDDFWVVKAKVTETISFDDIKETSYMLSKFNVRQDMLESVDESEIEDDLNKKI